MRKSLVALSTVAALGLFACQPNTQEKADAPALSAEKMTETQKQSYAMGASMGLFIADRKAQFEEMGLEFDVAALQQGFAEGMADTAQFDRPQLQELAQAGEQAFRAKQQEKAQAAAEENIEKGAAFLAENAKKDGVVTTESGLQYEIIEQGEGASPAATDTVKVHYRGTLIDGTQFDSSYDRGEPIEFPLNRVIPGWTEGVQLMQEGGKFRFYIPSELGYGARGQGQITPNSTLIFDVELLEVIKPEADAAEGE